MGPFSGPVAALVTLLAVISRTQVDARQPVFTIVGAKTLRPNSAYHAAVSVQPASGGPIIIRPINVRIAIEGPQAQGGRFTASQSVTLEPQATRVVKLEIGDVPPGDYNLTAVADGFKASQMLEYVAKSYSVFIQTDKAIYKPGDVIRFRCIVLDPHLRPGVAGAIDVHITDAKGNRVKQWMRALTAKGVFSGELPLSTSPQLGDWNITARVLGQTVSQKVLVAEYTLPKWRVQISAPPRTIISDGRVPVTVKATYTHGSPVPGEATVAVYPLIYSGVIQPIFQNPVRRVVKLADGEATLEVDITKDLELTDEYERTVVIEAIVEEAASGRRQNASTRVVLARHPYRLRLLKSADHYKPGLDYTATIFVVGMNGAPANGTVTVKHGFSYDSDSYTESQHQLDAMGSTELRFMTPPTNHSVLGLEAQYRDLHEWFPAVAAAISPEGVFLQTTLLTKDPQVNTQIEVAVNCTIPIKYASYQVLGRGDVQSIGAIRPNTPSTTATIKFMATHAMTPTAHVIVHFVTDNNELVADGLDIDIDGSLQNFVNLDTNVPETSPGKDVEITLQAKPNSYIGLLGVDQSVLLLREGNDISQSQVEEELRSYDPSRPSPYHTDMIDVDINLPKIWKPGSATARDTFEDAGAVILTSSNVPENFPLQSITERNEYSKPEYRVTSKPDQGPAVILNRGTRPPLAGPYAFSRIPRPRLFWNRPHVHLADPIPPQNTWLFANMSTGIDGKTVIRRTVPDTITSWVISAFSVDPVWGLGLMKAPKTFRVFQSFFVSIDLPYSVKRGEIIAIPAIIHNYLNQDLSIEVTLDNTDQAFEFADMSNDVQPPTSKIELYRRKKLTIKKGNIASVSFMITPKQLGFIRIKVTATSLISGDTVERKLLVVAEGETIYRNKALFIDLRKKPQIKTNITIDIPNNFVAGSEYLEISAVGDILGPSITNLENLIQMPHGCGEQNMLNFVPNILVLEYLKNTNQLTPAIQNRAIKFMELGYQQELTYQRADGSFSAFGEADPSGSVWLTAFVVRSFRQATPYITIEETIMTKAMKWLVEQQASNGSFPEVGKVSHRDMQGGAANGLALTAYTLISILEAQPPNGGPYSNAVSKAVDYVVRNLPSLNDIYATSICAYALQLANHPSKSTALNLLESQAKTATDLKWWGKLVPIGEKKNPWRTLPNSLDIEITSYAMLTYIQAGLIEDCLPVLRWLIGQRNQQGGFSSTQDTVIGLQALARLGEAISAGSSANVRVSYDYKVGAMGHININSQNSMVLQKHELPKKTRLLNITAEGNGFAIVQVSYKYNVNVTGPWPMFTLDPQVDKNSNQHHLQLSVCSGFAGTRSNESSIDEESNMVVMEVALPSGYTADEDSLPSLRASPHVKRVETKDSDTVVVMYFDHMSKRQEYCPTVSAYRTHKIAKQKPVPVTVYDYYDSSRRARVFYEPKETTLYDICEGEDCGDVNTSNPKTQKSSADDNNSDGGGAADYTPFTTLVILLLSINYLV